MPDVTISLLSIIFETSWQSVEIPDRFLIIGKQKTNGKAEGKKENPSKHRLVSLISVLGNIMEQICLKTISKQMEAKKGIWSSRAWVYQGQIIAEQSHCC